MAIQFRKIEKRDEADFLRYTRVFYASDAVDHDIPEAFHKDAFEEMLERDLYMFGYMFEVDGKNVGYAIISKTYSHEGGGMVWWIEEIYIEPEYRGQGVGKAFFDFIDEERKKDRAVTRLRLEVELDNEKAIKLYSSCGYEVLDYGQMIKQLRK